MSRRTAGPEAARTPASRPAASPDLKSRSIRWTLLALGAAYVAASLAGFRLDAVAPGLAYLPPIAGFLFMAAFFGATLREGSEPLVGRVARREHPHLTPELARYTRRLTVLWAASFLGLALASMALAAWFPYVAWSRWTHALAVAVPAALFFGEYLHRIRRYPRYAHAGPARLFVNIVRVVRDTATRSRAGTLPLLQCRSLSDAFLLGQGPTVVAGQFLGQAQALARALPESAHVINVCGGRHAFLVAFGAALIRGQVSLLPPGQARGDWERLLAEYPGATLLGDERPADAPASWVDVSPWLASDAYADEVPSIEDGRTAAILFTSGSTGESVGHAKTWGQLWSGARTWADALDWGDTTGLALLGSVPPQHMFGLEATVMLALYAGVPVHMQRPLLPADVAAALDREGRSFWWMTTPMHLRAALASSLESARMAGIVSSTMSLPPPAAKAAETRWKVPVIEVYGSTETGALATRRTATDEQWLPLPDVQLRSRDTGVVAEGPRVGTPIRLGDILEFAPDGRFVWRGRVADLVKVAGKRASLAALERRLQEIDGVDDATFYAPDAGGDEVKRLAAFYVSSTLEPEAVLEALRPLLDAVFLPRPLFRVARLPRNANGKLTRAALSELHDVCHAPERFTIGPDHPAIAGHFPGNPLVPGAVILARVAKAIGVRFPGRGPGAIASARFMAPLAPGQPATIAARREGNRVAFEVKHGEALLASGTWRVE